MQAIRSRSGKPKPAVPGRLRRRHCRHDLPLVVNITEDGFVVVEAKRET